MVDRCATASPPEKEYAAQFLLEPVVRGKSDRLRTTQQAIAREVIERVAPVCEKISHLEADPCLALPARPTPGVVI